MIYKNPFQLLQISQIEEATPEAIRRAKRKLLIDCDLTDDKTITYAGTKLSKDEIIRITDDFESSSRKDLHFLIASDARLLDFLTKTDLNFFLFYNDKEHYNQLTFQQFVAPFFTEIYDTVLFDIFNKCEHNTLRKVIVNNIFNNTSFEEQCYRSCYAAMSSLIATVKQFEKDASNANPTTLTSLWYQLRGILSEPRIRAINILPEYFQNIRNELAENLWNLAIEFQNKNAKKYSNNILTEISKYLITTNEIHNLINDYCSVQFKIQKQSNERGNSFRSYYVYIILFVFYYGFLKNCEDQSPKQNYIPYYNDIQQNQYNYQRQNLFKDHQAYIDSILQTIKGVPPRSIDSITLEKSEIGKYKKISFPEIHETEPIIWTDSVFKERFEELYNVYRQKSDSQKNIEAQSPTDTSIIKR